jgi:signal transduction histidine kinase
VTGRALVPIRRTFEAQRRFVADASHELRTPAALIRANAEVMEREGLIADDGRPLVADIITEADRLGRLVGDLLMLSTTGAADLSLERGEVELAELLRDAVRRVVPLAEEKRVDVVVDAVGPAIVDGDRDRLVQLVLILVDNAIDHAPAGTPVEVALRRRGGSVVLSVTDSGPGIPAEERERVFAPFARLASSSSDRRDGAGLGLAIARRIADAHGGTIVAGAGPAGGARLEVTLPAHG